MQISAKNKRKKNLGRVRLGLVQWKMRPFASLEDMFQQAAYFIDAISAYKSDFALLPEFFNAPLMIEFKDMNRGEAIRAVARYTDQIKERFQKLAVSYKVNIITGSLPLFKNNILKNVGYLCHRDGRVEMYEKIHITPDEEKYWDLKGGDSLQVFDTDSGKIGVLICYDVEFPELARLLAADGMQILFVPFNTDTQNAYLRVRICAQSRAVENECFVAITGSVGNLPEVDNMDLNYSHAAVFTPSDFPFPSNAVKSEATPNTEMILTSDVDLNLLEELHRQGSVQNLKNRRVDFYELKRAQGRRNK